ncbi:unnamed protein product [Prunus armeniaca]|uniref:NB-ARC domain-containing protein n=1 Tax=Prunus armeniaca TaxID=36596 RepID=A0A6J5VB77_PRUAR|nr:unnamed protein product [Prunus armeniaca]
MGLSHFQHLHKLCLKGKIDKLPDVCEFQRNLVKLSLIGSELQKDSIVQLERLPYLKMLVSGNQSYKWRELVSFSEGFPQLQVLHLVSLIGGMDSGRQCNDEAQASKDRKLPKTEKDSRKIELVYYYSREIRDCCNGHRFRTADLIESP